MTDRTDGSRSADPSDSPEAIPDTDPSDRSDDAGRSDDSGRPAAGSERPSDGPDGSPEGLRGWFVWFWTADSGSLVYLRDVVTSVVIVAGIGVLLFAASGVWPPMVAVESGSMEPNMERGDLVFIVDNDRFVPDGAVENAGEATGVVPADVAERHDRTKFGGHGDVVVFTPNGNDRQTPIIHRAMFWVEDGENWYDRADQAAIGGAADCEELNHCPAPHAGFITKGDNELTNANYDQTSRLSAPVRPEWIVGTAELRVPYLGHVRLLFSGVTAVPFDAVVVPEPVGERQITGGETTKTESDGETTKTESKEGAGVATRSAIRPASASPRLG